MQGCKVARLQHCKVVKHRLIGVFDNILIPKAFQKRTCLDGEGEEEERNAENQFTRTAVLASYLALKKMKGRSFCYLSQK